MSSIGDVSGKGCSVDRGGVVERVSATLWGVGCF